MNKLGRSLLMIVIFLGLWLLFYKILWLTSFPQLSQVTSLLSLLIVSILAFILTIVTFKNR